MFLGLIARAKGGSRHSPIFTGICALDVKDFRWSSGGQSATRLALAPVHPGAHNGAVRTRPGAIALSVVLLWALPRTLPQTANRRPAHAASTTTAAPVDINHATVEDLLKVPGMSRVWAERIVRFRPYRSKQDLVEQGVLTGVVYSRLKDHLIAHRMKP